MPKYLKGRVIFLLLSYLVAAVVIFVFLGKPSVRDSTPFLFVIFISLILVVAATAYITARARKK